MRDGDPDRGIASPWLTPAEAAAYAKVGLSTIYRAAASGALSGTKITAGKARSPWRFTVADLDAWLGGNRLPAVRRGRESPGKR